MRRQARVDQERGASLIELMIAVVLLGTIVVGVLSALGIGVRVSDIHRKLATAGAEVRSFAERVENQVSAGAGGYVNCATPGTYLTAYDTATNDPPSGFTGSVTSVQYWSAAGWVSVPPSPCTTDLGLQLVTLRVASNDGRAAESLAVVVRKPCSTAVQTLCAGTP